MSCSEDESVPIVAFWDTPYLPKYGGTPGDPQQLSLVDQEVIYNGLEKLTIKAAGDTTGVPSADIFDAIERPDHNLPFPDIVHQFISRVNCYAIDAREDNYNWHASSVKGLGPSRSLSFLPQEVIRGSTMDGFHRNEKPLLGTLKEDGKEKYLEYSGFHCANRRYRFLQAPTYPVPEWDGKGPRYHQLGVSDLSVEARLHFPRAIWPAHRTKQENEDARLGRVRFEDCFMCRSFEILQEVGLMRFRKKSRMRHSGFVIPNTAKKADPRSPMYMSSKGTQTEETWSDHEEDLARQRNSRKGSAPPPPDNTPMRGGEKCTLKPPRRNLVRSAEETPLKSRHRSLSVESPRTRTRRYAEILKTPPPPPRAGKCHQQRSDIRKCVSFASRSLSLESPVRTSTHQTPPPITSRCKDRTPTPGPSEKQVQKPMRDTPEKEKEKEKEKEERLKRDGQALYDEIVREEEEAMREHLQNKEKGIYHPCPNLNWDYKNSSNYEKYRRRLALEGIDHDTTDSDMELTNFSCNSTCECNRNKKILQSLEREEAEAEAETSKSDVDASRTPNSTYLYTTCEEEHGNVSKDESPASPPATPMATLPATSKFPVRPITQKLPFEAEDGDDADTSTNLDSTPTPTQGATQKPTDDGTDEDEEDDDEEEEEEEEDDDEEEEQGPKSTQAPKEPLEEAVKEDDDEAPATTQGAKKHPEDDVPKVDPAEASMRRKSAQHLYEVNKSGGELDLNLLPPNIMMLGYSPNGDLTFRTTSMDSNTENLFSTEEVLSPLKGAPPKEGREDAKPTDASNVSAEDKPKEASLVATPKKSSPPKRPHSSPFKTANKSKKVQTDLDDSETQDLTFTQSSDFPEYLTSRDWERQLKK